MKNLEKTIVCLVLLLMAYAVCGCEKEPVVPKYVNMPWKVYEGMTFYDERDEWIYDGNDFVLLKELVLEQEIEIIEPNELAQRYILENKE